MASISPLDNGQSFLDKLGKMTQRVRSWTEAVTRLAIIEGEDSPEGVIEARTARLYMDTTGSTGAVLYIKQLNDIGGDRTQGWVAIG